MYNDPNESNKVTRLQVGLYNKNDRHFERGSELDADAFEQQFTVPDEDIEPQTPRQIAYDNLIMRHGPTLMRMPIHDALQIIFVFGWEEGRIDLIEQRIRQQLELNRDLLQGTPEVKR